LHPLPLICVWEMIHKAEEEEEEEEEEEAEISEHSLLC
jgi:hypothetical protein